MKIKKIITTAVLVPSFILATVSPGHTICCSAADLNDITQGIRITLMAGLDNIAASLVEDKVDGMLGLAGDNTGQEKEIQAAMKSFEAATYSAAGTLKQHVLTKRVLENNRQYSPLSQSAFACCSDALAGIPTGQGTERGLNDTIYSSIHARNNQFNSVAQQSRFLRQEWPITAAEKVLKGSNIFPTNETLTNNEVAAGARLVSLSTNPVPAPRLSAGQSATTAGEQYEIIKGIKITKLAPSQKALSTILAANAPVYDMQDWAEQLYKATGRFGTPASVVNGKLSANAILNMRIDARYANPNYGPDMDRKPEAGLVRELAITKGIKLEVLQRRLNILQQTRVVLATQLATYLDLKFDKRLNEAHSAATIDHVQ